MLHINGTLKNCPDCRRIQCECPRTIGRLIPTHKDFIEETMKEFDEGDYVGVSPSDWNEDNIKGYNQHKEEFKKFLRSALIAQRTEMLSRLPEEKEREKYNEKKKQSQKIKGR